MDGFVGEEYEILKTIDGWYSYSAVNQAVPSSCFFFFFFSLTRGRCKFRDRSVASSRQGQKRELERRPAG